MLIKVESEDGNFQRIDECHTGCIVINKEQKPEENLLICSYNNKTDYTYPLSIGDKVYFMNECGKTVDKIVIV